MRRTFYVLVAVLVSANGQTPQSPCPGIFDYEGEGDDVHGVIHVTLKDRVTSAQLKIKFTLVARLYSNYYGRLVPDQRTSGLTQLNAGEKLKYRVDFPLKSPLPKLTELSVNGDNLCHGEPENPQPGQTVTTISLGHTHSTPVRYITNHNTNTFKIPNLDKYIDKTFFYFQGPVQGIPTVQFDPKRFELKEPYVPPPPTPVHVAPPPVTPASEQSSNSQYDCGRPRISTPLLLGGEEYVRGGLPWLVALSTQKKLQVKFICAGTLVSDHHVVTAAHCQRLREEIVEVEMIIVTIGAFDLDDLQDEHAKKVYVKDAIPYPDYDSFTFKNDIMVLVLKKRVVFNDYVIPICLWGEDKTDINDIVGRKGVIAGWGTSEKNQGGHGRPLKARIPIVSTEECRKSHKGFLKLTTDVTICAGDRNKIVPCSGDSGGGMFLRYKGGNDNAWRLRGVVSVSLENEDDDNDYECNTREYVVFTDAAKFSGWIRNIIQTT